MIASSSTISFVLEVRTCKLVAVSGNNMLIPNEEIDKEKRKSNNLYDVLACTRLVYFTSKSKNYKMKQLQINAFGKLFHFNCPLK